MFSRSCTGILFVKHCPITALGYFLFQNCTYMHYLSHCIPMNCPSYSDSKSHMLNVSVKIWLHGRCKGAARSWRGTCTGLLYLSVFSLQWSFPFESITCFWTLPNATSYSPGPDLPPSPNSVEFCFRVDIYTFLDHRPITWTIVGTYPM